jgi:hypothetical protein
MRPDASYQPFSKEVWQSVTNHARQTLICREYCPDQSRVEALRCVFYDSETDHNFGRQVWFFEATGLDPVGRQHLLFGALEFSVEFGLLEPVRAALTADAVQRQGFLSGFPGANPPSPWQAASTHVWVRLTVASVFILTAIWLLKVGAVLR